MMNKIRSLGIDIGSTTTKVVLIGDGKVLYEKYERHLSRIWESVRKIIDEASELLSEAPFTLAISGSAGLGVAGAAGIDFVQEVYATGEAIARLAPDTGAVIELGGEDAKVIFFKGGTDERMNGTCAGGTGAFIDQMAVLLNMSVDEMDSESLKATRLYPIASRCGVFAKTDIQPLLNQGAVKADVAASIFQAVVNQTIAGLIQGRKIEGKIMFLGGPMHYCMGLRKRFCETLMLDGETAVFPEYDRYAVAMGAAFYAQGGKTVTYKELSERIGKAEACGSVSFESLSPLFESTDEYEDFKSRHSAAGVSERNIGEYIGKAWLGIDCGSTTTKLVLISDEKELLYTFYSSNKGNPVSLVKEQLTEIRKLCGDRIVIAGSCVTGYGEDIIKNAFHADSGIVETIAHFTSAEHFLPSVDFILDIGGQDIKCFKIRNGAIDSIMLNEACSSGCGSFIETFARSMGYEIADFAKLGLLAKAPVNLGSRCTVFMNSSVKQSQKDGATVSDISAGLSMSVVKNALYKVIRTVSPSELGEHIVVQGGTFYNDAVLRSFEKELGSNVVRPAIAGLMGAYGAALHIMNETVGADSVSTLLNARELAAFTHKSSPAVCHGCQNNCHLTVNTFSDGKKYISGNQCSRGAGGSTGEALPDIHEWKRKYLTLLSGKAGKRGKIGIPMVLSMFEFAPLWHALFTSLGYEVCFSAMSSRKTYENGQLTIPSDTICYPAKLMHGHVIELICGGCNVIFYPSLTYNIDEHAGDNHYNCPVVAYYGEVIGKNMTLPENVRFIYPYLNCDSQNELVNTLKAPLQSIDKSIKSSEIKRAVKAGFEAYMAYRNAVMREGETAISYAAEHGKRVMVLAGRPYHIDPEIGHSIDRLAASLGFVVVSEDSVCHLSPLQYVKVLDQWTFHSRLYRAAAYAAEHKNTELVQLVSFGCGVDAITTDEVRSILEKGGKHYTQIKIDEITNSGAVRVRLRSLLGALDAQERAMPQAMPNDNEKEKIRR